MRLSRLVSLQTILAALLRGHNCLCSTLQYDQLLKPSIVGPNHPIRGHHGDQPFAPSPLKARVAFPPTFLGDEWIVDHHDFGCLLPVVSAAAELINFYESVAGFAALANAVTSQSYRMYMGDIMLEVRVPPGYDVRWDTVVGFANWMLDMTRRGYVNTYQINFIHGPTGLLFTFSLWVGYKRAAADTPS